MLADWVNSTNMLHLFVGDITTTRLRKFSMERCRR